MGHPRPDAERVYVESQLGNRWKRLLANGQIFNRFVDYATHESKIDRDKIVKRLRVFSSRDEAPTAFWTVLMTKFYDEGAHFGLRKYVDEGVTYYCPPHLFLDFKTRCQSAPSYKSTVRWVFRPDYFNGWIFAHVFCAGNKKWFKRNWPNALKLRGQRYLISYYPEGSVDELSDYYEEEYDEDSLESYKISHSLLCLMFGTKSPAAYDLSVGRFASKGILEIVRDPYLGLSSPGFRDAALSIAALCADEGRTLTRRPVKQQVLQLLDDLAKAYPQFESTMMGDADYMYPMTYPLMPLSKKSTYGAVIADFEAGMKSIVIDQSEDIFAITKQLKTEDDDVCLHNAFHVADDREHYSIDVVRQFLASVLIQDYMPLQAFDAILDTAESIKGKPGEIVEIVTLKKIVSERVKKLTDTVDSTGAFPIIGALFVALMEIGHVRSEMGRTDYGDLLYRTETDSPWLSTPVKFLDDGPGRLDDIRNEFLAYCRIVTGK